MFSALALTVKIRGSVTPDTPKAYDRETEERTPR